MRKIENKTRRDRTHNKVIKRPLMVETIVYKIIEERAVTVVEICDRMKKEEELEYGKNQRERPRRAWLEDLKRDITRRAGR